MSEEKYYVNKYPFDLCPQCGINSDKATPCCSKVSALQSQLAEAKKERDEYLRLLGHERDEFGGKECKLLNEIRFWKSEAKKLAEAVEYIVSANGSIGYSNLIWHKAKEALSAYRDARGKST